MKKIIVVLLAILVFGCFGIDAKTTKKSGKKKSSSSKIIDNKVNNDRYNTQTSIPGITSFTIDSKEVKIPALNSFQPLLKQFPKTSKKIKSIKIYYITGLAGEIGDDLKYFNKASSLSQAKKIYSTDCITFDFNKNQQIECYKQYLGSNRFQYDNKGHIISIIDEEWGYRGSPVYEIKYTISWQGDKPESISRDIIEFESEYEEPNDENLPFKLNFFSDPLVSNILAMLKSKKTEIKIKQNTCRISGITQVENEFNEKGDKVVYWVEIEYY